MKVDDSLPQRLIRLRLPGIGLHKSLISRPAANAVTTTFHSIALADNNRDIEANQGAYVRNTKTARSDDLYRLPLPRN